MLVQRSSNTLNWKQCLLAVGALAAGVMVYGLDRPTETTLLGRWIHGALETPSIQPSRLGLLGGIIPELVHPFGFALLTLALFPHSAKKTRIGLCAFWLTVELLFECGQGIGWPVAHFFMWAMPQHTASTMVANYFVFGTFDPLDILAICVGIVAAYAVAEKTAIPSLAIHQKGG
ncbi:MAG: hypothetical protein JRI36_10245 [Deltaproteobacteria bacterium]|nr:hypothetical protein [Deltaproteobacteria bacterium]